MLPADRSEHFARKIGADLVARSWQGAWGHPAAMLLAFGTSRLANRAPVVMWSAFGTLAVLSVLRAFLLRQVSSPEAAFSRRWRVWHTSVVMLCAALWGLTPAYATYALGRYDQDTMIFFIFHAAIAVGTITLLIHDVKMMRLALVLLFASPIAAQILAGGKEFLNPILVYVVYMLYLTTTGRKLNRAYIQQISDNYDLAVLAHRDHLTGLPNRLLMTEALESSLADARERGRRVAVLYIDFDGFKQINDRHSHRIGDLFLREVAERLATCVSNRGIVARLGGDEFSAVITEITSVEKAAEMAETVLRSAREPVSIEGSKLDCSASIGISLFPDNAGDADHLLRAADQAMYSAKTSGKNRFCFSTAPERNEEIQRAKGRRPSVEPIPGLQEMPA
jgi:diguanylate cyclase (GGDEF)-like protein